MSNLMNWIIITLLSFSTLRDVIAWTGLIKYDWKYSYVFYGKYDKELLRITLRELGFDKMECNLIKKEIKTTARRSMFNTKNKNSTDLTERLITLLSKYIINFNDKIQYGDKTPTQSNFYISTMEASHNKFDLNIMSDLIQELILMGCKEGKIPKIPDFILTPKGGNPLLGNAYADKQQCIKIFRKSSKDKSNAKISPQDYEKKLMTNFEGSWELVRLSESLSNKKLFGVVIDCNLSGGAQIMDLMDEFNKIIESMELNVEKVTNAYVLFRVDNDGEDVDKKFSEKSYFINRYFDLNEEMKKNLFDLKGDKESIDNYNKQDERKIKEFIHLLKDKRLYKKKVDCCDECSQKTLQASDNIR